MQIFVYEFICGGGMWALGDEAPAGDMLHEGRGMLRALVQDLVDVPGTVISVARDARLSPQDLDLPARVFVDTVTKADEERGTIARLSKVADATILIAPEFYGMLAERCGWVTSAGGRLWSPPIEFVQLTSNKHDTAFRLRERGVKVPDGLLWTSGMQWPPVGHPTEPVVLKPNDGCGSQEVHSIADRSAWPANPPREPTRVEKLIPGQQASIAVLTGPDGTMFPLPACLQRLTSDATFRYLGGALPLEPAWQARAEKLARATLQALPKCCGYVGIDFIFGAAEDGSEDTVIEVNPRLTTSYVGLRELCRGNLAWAMMQVCRGELPELSFATETIEFTADGQVSRANLRTPS